jgi:hypothetical protein
VLALRKPYIIMDIIFFFYRREPQNFGKYCFSCAKEKNVSKRNALTVEANENVA